MSRFVVYIAVSLDGYIADGDGEVHWLEAFEKDIYGYEEFLDSVGSILMGRVTCEQVLSFGDWPYGDIPTLVWSGSGLLPDLPGTAHKWSGDLGETVSRLKEDAQGRDVWVLGGARTVQTFLAAGEIDRLDLFVVPVLLGDGLRLFDHKEGGPQMLKLEGVQPYANGVVHLSYNMRQEGDAED